MKAGSIKCGASFKELGKYQLLEKDPPRVEGTAMILPSVNFQGTLSSVN